jgi:two-component system, chemotaxis family, CheB/CheR fusion protein
MFTSTHPADTLTILNSVLQPMETGHKQTAHLPIDAFFRSLAEDQRERAICIVLSGTGTDGTLGMKVIKGESGMAMVQEPQSAKYAGMPASAIATGLADYVLPPATMPKELIAYAQGPYLTNTAVKSSGIDAESMGKIFVLLRNRTGHDFSAYKNTTIHRRIEHQALHRSGQATGNAAPDRRGPADLRFGLEPQDGSRPIGLRKTSFPESC